MSDVNFFPLPTEINELYLHLEKLIFFCKKNLRDFEKRHFNSSREDAILYVFSRAINLSEGSMICAKEFLVEPTELLSRSLLEALIWTRYITVSDECAKEFIDNPLEELERNLYKNITKGYARLYEINTNETISEELLNKYKEKKKPKKITILQAAELGGLDRLYTQYYGFMSMEAHGRAYKLFHKIDLTTQLFASISSVIGFLQCIYSITADWIKYRKMTSREFIYRSLGA